MSEHHHAGQGPVLLDVGDGVGAIVVVAPTLAVGSEIGVHAPGAHPAASDRHVGVVDRSGGSSPRPLPVAVFPGLVQGDYTLYERPSGVDAVRVTVRSGEVTELTWPDG